MRKLHTLSVFMISLVVCGCLSMPADDEASAVATVVQEFGSRAPPKAKPSFGLYLLALTWLPSFCCGHPGKDECKALGGSFGATHVTLHGLWPNYSDEESQRRGEDYPSFCGRYQACDRRDPPGWCAPDPSTIPAEMSQYGPGYVNNGNFLAKHEWPKHGSCTGLEPGRYFAAALQAMLDLPGDRGTPSALSSHVGQEVPVEDLRASFGPPKSVLLSCDQRCQLRQVSVCLARDERGVPTTPTKCPVSVSTTEYSNGCSTRRCATVRIQASGQCSGVR